MFLLQVREILIPPRYYGQITSYSQDIALLDLTHSVQLHAGIMPVCIDWQREFTVTPGMLGTVKPVSYTHLDVYKRQIPKYF